VGREAAASGGCSCSRIIARGRRSVEWTSCDGLWGGAELLFLLKLNIMVNFHGIVLVISSGGMQWSIITEAKLKNLQLKLIYVLASVVSVIG